MLRSTRVAAGPAGTRVAVTRRGCSTTPRPSGAGPACAATSRHAVSPTRTGPLRLDNGDILVTEIAGSWITRITRAGQFVWSVQAPRVRSPSDAFPTQDGQIILADFSKPGRVVVFDPVRRRVTWQYDQGWRDDAGPSVARP